METASSSIMEEGKPGLVNLCYEIVNLNLDLWFTFWLTRTTCFFRESSSECETKRQTEESSDQEGLLVHILYPIISTVEEKFYTFALRKVTGVLKVLN